MIIQSCKYHRNGVFGVGYYALRLAWRGDARRYSGWAICFESDEFPTLKGCIAIISDEGESFRYEHFEREIRAYIASPAAQQKAFT